MLRDEFGAKLRELRIAKGWSQVELQHKAGYTSNSNSYVSRVEQGLVLCGEDTMNKLLAPLGFKVKMEIVPR